MCCVGAQAQRGRKYKAPPPTSHIEVYVIKASTGKPVGSAAVIFHSVLNGVDEGNLEVKTDEAGKAIIDVIPTGSTVDVQVIADGMATFAQQYTVPEDSRTIQVKLISPRAQLSEYEDNSGKAAARAWGVQEPDHPDSPAQVQTPKPAEHSTDPAAPSPVGNTATPGNSQNQQTGHPSGVPPTL